MACTTAGWTWPHRNRAEAGKLQACPIVENIAGRHDNLLICPLVDWSFTIAVAVLSILSAFTAKEVRGDPRAAYRSRIVICHPMLPLCITA